LFQTGTNADRKPVKKRKSKRAGTTSMTPDLNLPCDVGTMSVPVGLVNSRVNQFAGAQTSTDGDDRVEEMLKKQKRATNPNDAISAAAAEGSPRRAQ
jgi:hypothetical protein